MFLSSSAHRKADGFAWQGFEDEMSRGHDVSNWKDALFLSHCQLNPASTRAWCSLPSWHCCFDSAIASCVFFICPLAFVNAWHRRLFRTFGKSLYPLHFIFLIYVLQVNYFLHFLLFSGSASPKKQHILCFPMLNYSIFPSAQKYRPRPHANGLYLPASRSPQDYVTAQAPSQTFSWGKHKSSC